MPLETTVIKTTLAEITTRKVEIIFHAKDMSREEFQNLLKIAQEKYPDATAYELAWKVKQLAKKEGKRVFIHDMKQSPSSHWELDISDVEEV
jgi:hypothetical protein